MVILTRESLPAHCPLRGLAEGGGVAPAEGFRPWELGYRLLFSFSLPDTHIRGPPPGGGGESEVWWCGGCDALTEPGAAQCPRVEPVASRSFRLVRPPPRIMTQSPSEASRHPPFVWGDEGASLARSPAARNGRAAVQASPDPPAHRGSAVAPSPHHNCTSIASPLQYSQLYCIVGTTL